MGRRIGKNGEDAISIGFIFCAFTKDKRGEVGRLLGSELPSSFQGSLLGVAIERLKH